MSFRPENSVRFYRRLQASTKIRKISAWRKNFLAANFKMFMVWKTRGFIPKCMERLNVRLYALVYAPVYKCASVSVRR